MLHVGVEGEDFITDLTPVQAGALFHQLCIILRIVLGGLHNFLSRLPRLVPLLSKVEGICEEDGHFALRTGKVIVDDFHNIVTFQVLSHLLILPNFTLVL